MGRSSSKIEQIQADWAFICEASLVLYEKQSPDLVHLAITLMDYAASLFAQYKLEDTYEPARELGSDLLRTLDAYSYVAFLRRFKAFREWWIQSITMLIDECLASLDYASPELSADALCSILFTTELLHETHKHALVFDAYEMAYENGYDAMLLGALLVILMSATIQIASAQLYPLLLVVGFSENTTLRHLLAWVIVWNASELMNLPEHHVANWQESLATVYSATKDALEKGNAYKVLAKEFRLTLNPSGTGKNPEYEREVAESQLDLPEDAPSPLEIAPGSEPDPAQVVADRDAVEHLLARFGKRTADLLRLMMEGKTTAEAARELGMSESTARTLLERARKQFSRDR